MIDLDDLETKAYAATPGARKVSKSNGTITAIDMPSGHESTVAFAVNIDDEFSRIDIDDRDAAFIEAVTPDVVLVLISRLRDLERSR